MGNFFLRMAEHFTMETLGQRNALNVVKTGLSKGCEEPTVARYSKRP